MKIKVKALRNKYTKEFLKIIEYNDVPTLFTSEIPIMQPLSATIELMISLYGYEHNMIFNDLEFVELEVIDFGEVGADIRNKLSPPKNLVALLEVFFETKVGYVDERSELVDIIKKEMKQSKKSIDYIANLL